MMGGSSPGSCVDAAWAARGREALGRAKYQTFIDTLKNARDLADVRRGKSNALGLVIMAPLRPKRGSIHRVRAIFRKM